MKMQAIGMSSIRRSPVLPDVPTIDEAGVPGYDFVTWNGVVAPAGTPARVVQRLNGEIVKAINHPDVIARLAADGAEPAATSPAEFAAYIESELKKCARITAAAGIAKQ